MNLLPGEIILSESSSKRLLLTTHRIRFQSEAVGRAEIKSIMLEELASCALRKNSYPGLLVLAALCFLIGLLLGGMAGSAVFFVLGVAVALCLVIAYFLNQPQIIAFESAGTTIRLNTQGTKLEFSKSFIDDTELAKNERYLLLKSSI